MPKNLEMDFINFYDRSLFLGATNYDLSNKADRLRSVSDLEKLFFRILTFLSPDLFIEAGAKDARTSHRARRHLSNCRIVAFEANPYTYKRFNIESRNDDLKIEYLNLALADKKGILNFNVRLIGGNPSADGSGSILSSISPSTSVSVESDRLDRVFTCKEFKKCAIWIDVEGANKNVLLGAKGILKATQTIFIEVQDRELWQGQWLSKDVSLFLFKNNFVPFARCYQSRYLYNIIFIKKDLLWQDRIRYFLAQHLSKLS